MSSENEVGPILCAGRMGEAIAQAIAAENPRVLITHRGSYLRVMVPGRCRVSRETIENHLGGTFRLPGDLERVMPSFCGRLILSDDLVCWEGGGGAGRPR